MTLEQASLLHPMPSRHFEKFNPGVGATNELSLRVSVATLVRVIFENPENGGLMLALERKATFLAAENRVRVNAQPFGGTIHINDLDSVTGAHRRLSLRQRALPRRAGFSDPDPARRLDYPERFLPGATPASGGSGARSSSPVRELEEEFQDALGLSTRPGQYQLDFLWTLVENEPEPTGNIQAEGQPTVRIYRVFEARLADPALTQAISLNSQRCSDQDLRDLAMEDLRKGGRGWANAVLALPLESLHQLYRSLSPARRNSAISFGEINLEESVPALLNGITVPRFQSV